MIFTEIRTFIKTFYVEILTKSYTNSNANTELLTLQTYRTFLQITSRGFFCRFESSRNLAEANFGHLVQNQTKTYEK